MPTTSVSNEQHKIWLFFKSPELEKEYRLNYEEEIRVPLRYGIIISILSWLAGIPLVYYVIPERFADLSLIITLGICPLFLFFVFATYSQRFTGWLHIFGAISNAWAGSLAVYVCGQFPNGATFTLPVLIFIIFFGSYMVRLRWIAGVIAALTYIIGFQVFIVFFEPVSGDQVAMYAFIAWLTWIFATVAGRVVEMNSRIQFIQRKTIHEQAEIISQEKEAADALLLNILPPFIASRLKTSVGVIADKHEDASVLFADIVGFTNLASRLSPDDIIKVLNRVFSHFDMLSERYELEKIKTIGDGYFVAGGLTKSKEFHLRRIAQMGLDMLTFIREDEEMRKLDLKIRIGLHVGPVVAGVIGQNKFSYDLWGETVNLGSRLESHGEVGKLCVSEAVYARLKELFTFETRDLVDIKGIGSSQTYFLLEKIA